MANRQSLKIEIINHFDNLINRVDIDIEEAVGKYSEEQVLSQLNCFEIEQRNLKSIDNFSLKCFESTESEKPIRYQTVDQWPDSMKVIDYLNRIREKTISELRKAQEDTLSNYQLNSSRFKSTGLQLNDEMNMDEIRSQVLNENFYYQVLYKPDNPKYAEPWIFSLYTFISDFYMSPDDINLLEASVNTSQEHGAIFDEKMVLIGLLQKQFFQNLQTEKFPSHMIISRKQDLLNVQKIDCNFRLSRVNLTPSSIDLSNLEELKLNGNKIRDAIEINVEGLSSLKHLRLEFNCVKQITLRNLPGIRELNFIVKAKSPINSEVLSNFSLEISDYLPNIETLGLVGFFSNLNLDNMVNLKKLKIHCYLMDDFNFDLFKNLCNQLERVMVVCEDLDDNFLTKLFYGHNFPYLDKLLLIKTKITKLEKRFFDRFPMLQTLSLYENRQLRKIDRDAFSDLKHLNNLNLRDNCIKSIYKSHFSNLTKMESLVLDGNPLKHIKEYVFSNLKSLRNLCLDNIQLTSLGPKSLAGLNNLEMLSLKNNKLTNFEFDILANMRRIKEIDLSGNPIINKDVIFYSLANGGKVFFKYS